MTAKGRSARPRRQGGDSPMYRTTPRLNGADSSWSTRPKWTVRYVGRTISRTVNEPFFRGFGRRLRGCLSAHSTAIVAVRALGHTARATIPRREVRASPRLLVRADAGLGRILTGCSYPVGARRPPRARGGGRRDPRSRDAFAHIGASPAASRRHAEQSRAEDLPRRRGGGGDRMRAEHNVGGPI